MTARIVLADDMTGEDIPSGGGGPFTFSIQGTYYRLDLSDASQDEFKSLIAEYIARAEVIPSPEMPQHLLPDAMQDVSGDPGQKVT